MKSYKLLLTLSICSLMASCESIPKDIQSLGTTLNIGIKTLNTTLNNTSPASNTTKLNSAKGMLTTNECKSSQGKTKTQIETMINEKLTDARAYSLNSFAVTYNFQISDQTSRYGVNSNSKAICSLIFEGNQLSSKVIHWSIIG
ncbi:hypothetical protein MXL34_04015 [Acinetobacter baumannii]|uniref:hypothetical protein n=1 Tax=Acinetobacter baumannii TaxID=470 RepID=UPI002DBC13AB|nr:hypothetical protein [Acinetobacter baumannii]MEB6636324.1 hypothetical protein [Acinetobacter baumannii]